MQLHGIRHAVGRSNCWPIHWLLVCKPQLRLHLMRRHLKEAEADEKPLQRYACPGCGETYSSMDAANLLDFATGELRCGECRCAMQGCSWLSVLCLLLLHCVELEVVLFSARLWLPASHRHVTASEPADKSTC